VHPEVSVQWEVRKLQREIPFATVGDRPRKYALVKLKISRREAPCWIWEFGRPDSFAISTLLFTLVEENSTADLETVITQILEEALLPQGGWHSSPLVSEVDPEN